jgi:hypothetical protein
MFGPSGFFCFTHLQKASKGADIRYAIAYKPPGPLQRGALDELMLAMCKGPNVPDAVVIVALAEDERVDLLLELKTDGARLAQQRLSGRIPIVFARYSLRTGAALATLLDGSFRGRKAELDRTVVQGLAAWMESGLLAAFDPSEVVLQAPSGYAYQKPSGARAEFFLKPDLALTSSATVAFVALALFHKLYAGRPSSFTELQTVFVDTMAIAPVAYALRDLLSLCGYKEAFHIESFHSYGGFETVKRPLPRTSLCLISASSSMSLHEQWMVQKEVARNEVVTLLTFKAAPKFRDCALLAIEQPGGDTAAGPAQLSIRIKGETFLPEQEPAKKVLLTDQHHRSDDDVRLFCSLAGKGVFDVYRRPPKSSAKVRALFVDGGRLLDQQEFLEWLEQQLLQTVKAATRVVVYQDDTSSRRLAELVKQFCEVRLKLSELHLVSASELTGTQLSTADGVIVCATVVGKGSQLLEVSRSLRDKHEGPRLYLLGYQVAETRSELKALLGNLRHSKSVPYEIARYGAAAIGTQLLASYDQEVKAYYGPSRDLRTLPGLMTARGNALGSTSPVGGLVLLPHGEDVSDAMRLRAGFAYWSTEYVPQACQAEVLATVAVLLQRARENDKLPDDKRLATSSYRHVVLDPENFTRFNDGVLQAALLRCAYASELDYRADHAASDFMKAVILRSLARSTQEAGEGILEFLAALAMKRLQLTESHDGEVRAAALTTQIRPAKLQKAIEYLLARPHSGDKGARKIPF